MFIQAERFLRASIDQYNLAAGNNFFIDPSPHLYHAPFQLFQRSSAEALSAMEDLFVDKLRV